MPAPDIDRALSFGRAAEEYARWRPSYPDEAVDFLATASPARVADVGAGTGQLTGALLERGLVVDAVDADASMLGVLTRIHPSARPHLARADALPFRSASLDAVLVATAFHWFPFEETVREVARVLKPGGWLGLAYHFFLPVEDWQRDLGVLHPDHDPTAPGRPDPSWPFPPGDVETGWFPWDWHLTPEGFRNNLATASGLMRMPGAERLDVLGRAEAIVERACRAAASATVPVHYETFCVRWRPEPGS